MKTHLALAALSVLSSFSAMAYPVGDFVCGKGDTTNEISISKMTVGAETLPYMKVHIQRPELESRLSGFALLIEITDKTSGVVQRWISLPGSNVDISYTKDDELESTKSANKCRRVL